MPNQKRKGEKTPNLSETLQVLLIHSFYPENKEESSPPITVSEVKCQAFIRVVQEKFRQYLLSESNNSWLHQMLQRRLSDQEIEQFKANQLSRELISAKTLKRCYDSFYASQTTIEFLNAYQRILTEEKEQEEAFERQISRVAGTYLEYATHNTSTGTFQVSMTKISKDGKAITRFRNAARVDTETNFTVRLIGTTGLLLTHESEDYVLIFYLYMGEVNQPEFIQGVHLYSNRIGNTVANLAVFQRLYGQDEKGNRRELTEEEQERELRDFKPSRERKTLLNLENPYLETPLASHPKLSIGENIQRFLIHQIKPISTLLHEQRPFNFRKQVVLSPASNSKPAPYYDIQEEFIGEYDLYFNERYPSKKSQQNKSLRNDFFSTIGIARLKIEADKTTGILTCQMKMQKHEKSEKLFTYQGKVINHQLKDPSTLILAMYLQPSQHRYLHLLFNIINENLLIGCFNIAYATPQQLGAGVVFAMRRKEKDTLEELTKNASPFLSRSIIASTYTSKSKVEEQFVNFLSQNPYALVFPPDYHQLEMFSSIPYWGIYRMYFLTGRTKKEIATNLLIIRGNGWVSLSDEKQDHIEGKIERCNDSQLTLTLRDNENKRTGFCCIHVDNISPRRKQQAIYVGSYAGFSRSGDQTPVASIFILEYVPLPQEIDDSTADWQEFIDSLKEQMKQGFSIPKKAIAFFKKQQPAFRFEHPAFSWDDL